MYHMEIKNLKKSYSIGKESMDVLRGISFTINKGEFVAITGPSGCGKSTLLHILGGLGAPTSGEVKIDGVSLYEKSPSDLARYRRKEVGIVYQFYNLVPELTAEENLILPMLMNREKADPAYVDEVLDLLGMRDRRSFYPSELSGGQQQKIAIGRALLYHPSLLLADEPTGNLDSAKRDEVLELFTYLNESEGMTILMVTHDQTAAQACRQRSYMLDGKMKRGQDSFADRRIEERVGGVK